MATEFNLGEYLCNGVERIVKGALKAAIKNPKESIFLTKYALQSKEANRIRKSYENAGQHIPPFLIASIASTCNLHCKGCYARENKSCSDEQKGNQLTAGEWERIFREALDVGISFILLAGGEPLLRQDVIESAAKYPNIIFPIFTNGILIETAYLKLFDKNRNLLPIISLEGDESFTDERRGVGVYQTLVTIMEQMNKQGIFFGVSITVTKENIHKILSKDFLMELRMKGCKIVFYVEYVPVNSLTIDLAPTDTERAYMDQKLLEIRGEIEDMILISFPGDEKSSGGCLAAGRGFFHINAYGATEPCPFSPFSDTNIRDTSLLNALHSPLFQKLKDKDILMQDHTGGCVLFDQEEVVKKLLSS